MSAHDLLIQAGQRGLRIMSDGTNLHIRPARLLTTDFADLLREHKSELLALLARVSGPQRRQVVKPHRFLTQREWAILMRSGAQNDPVIIEALKLFNAKIVE